MRFTDLPEDKQEAVRQAIRDGGSTRGVARQFGISAHSVNRVRGALTAADRINARDSACECGEAKQPQDPSCRKCWWLDGQMSPTLGRMVSELRAMGGAASLVALADAMGVKPETVERNWYRFVGRQDRIDRVTGSPHDPPIFVLRERMGVAV